jgi:hypothetical protein
VTILRDVQKNFRKALMVVGDDVARMQTKRAVAVTMIPASR